MNQLIVVAKEKRNVPDLGVFNFRVDYVIQNSKFQTVYEDFFEIMGYESDPEETLRFTRNALKSIAQRHSGEFNQTLTCNVLDF